MLLLLDSNGQPSLDSSYVAGDALYYKRKFILLRDVPRGALPAYIDEAAALLGR